MKNILRRKNSENGFTLAEVLATVAIILILAGVTFVSVVQYQKNLRLMEMDGTAKEIFVAAQNHLSLAKASGDLDRLATASTGTGTATDAAYGTKLGTVPSYAGDANGQYYYVIHNAAQGAGSETYIPAEGTSVYDLMLPFGALDGTVQQGGNYAIVYERKSASVVAVLYSGAGNASFGNASTIQLDGDDVQNIEAKKLYSDSSARKAYEKSGTTVVVGCYTGKAGSNANLDVKTLEAPKLVVKNEAKLHAIVSGNYTKDEQITLYIKGVQSGALASRVEDCKDGDNSFDITIDDITGDGSMRFTNLCGTSAGKQRFTHDGSTPQFTVGENIEVYATVSATDALATPKNSTTYTVSSLFGDRNSDTDTSGNTSVYIMNLRHLENLGENISGFQGALHNANGSGGNITAEQRKDLTMFTDVDFSSLNGNNIYNMSVEKTYAAANTNYTLTYKGNGNTIHSLQIGAQNQAAAGIFGETTNALTVQNLTLEDNSASGASSTSVLVGKAAQSTLTISKIVLKNNKVSSAANAGVLVGEAAASTSLDISQVILQNDQVSDAVNAGMLVGNTAAQKLKVSEVLAAYYAGKLNFSSVETIENYDAEIDSNTYVAASGSAGGLIGLVSGGKLDIQASAASVYVKGGTAAGGFIGTVSNGVTGTVKNSYVGGHTKEGKYSTDVDGAGRYNVQATEASGVAGGFIGVSTNSFTIKNVYTTASSYAPDAAKSGSFYGSGTVKIQSSYYATGTHNGTAPSDADIEKTKVSTSQAPQRAIAYDRTLLGATAEQPHPAMDTISYPMNTIRHLRPATEDGSLPWFIMDHIGDWVVPGEEKGKAEFEVDNGNRLTVRINTGLQEIREPLKYKLKVHGETSNQDIYFNIDIDENRRITVKREHSNWELEELTNIAECKTIDGELSLDFYLDDITRKNGNFLSVCKELLYPGEDITINVAPVEKVNGKEQAVFDDSKEQITNSIFGYMKPSAGNEGDAHNNQKINAVKAVNSTLDTNSRGWGLIPVGNTFYAQIDNSRHLQNLSADVSYYGHPFKDNSITGAIQTDNIYWAGNNNAGAYTQSITAELGGGSGFSVWNRESCLETDSHYHPIIANNPIYYYNGSGFKISGITVNQNNSAAGLFGELSQAIEIKNLTLENADIICNGNDDDHAQAGGFIGYAKGNTTLENVHLISAYNVEGSKSVGSFIGQTDNGFKISDASIDCAITVRSKNGNAGGLVGYKNSTNLEATITNVKYTGNLTIDGKCASGGIIGNAGGKSTVKGVTFNSDVTVISSSENAAGVVGSAGGESDIQNVIYDGKLTAYGHLASGGVIGKTGSNVTIKKVGITYASTITSQSEDAGGIVGYAQSASFTLEDAQVFGANTEIIAKKNAGGVIGTVTNNSKFKASNIAVSGFVKSYEENAGGLIGVLNTGGTGNVLEKSYYAGRTITGIYNPITINDNKEPYTSNVSGQKAVGGIVGLIKNANGLTIQKCFSTGSVGNTSVVDKETAGGFIGYSEPWGANMTISNCYSMGEVTGLNPQNGGFIGKHQGGINFGENVIYLNSFNSLSKSAVGYANQWAPSGSGSITTVSTNDSIVSSSSEEKAGFTQTYDKTLPEQYPYKIWTEDWQDTKNKITYHGDWPSPQINGTLVYYHRDGGDKTKGICTLVSSEVSFQTEVTAAIGDNWNGQVEPYGFGIILDYLPNNKDDWQKVSNLYTWATTKETFDTIKETELPPMSVSNKYSTFSYGGKNYFFARITADDLPKNHFFAKNKTKDIYEVTYNKDIGTIKIVSQHSKSGA